MHVVYFLLTRFQMDFMWLKLFCLQVSKKKKKKKKKNEDTFLNIEVK